jgi:hypothetical protein
MTKVGVSVRYGEYRVLFGCAVRCTINKLLVETDGEEFNVT